nr:MAG TPA: hypothetical protein [Caudoviricetes sp.]
MSKFNTTSIRLTSRASIKIGDSFFTFEACEEKQCAPEIASTITDDELAEARQELWDLVNNEVDKQIAEIRSYVNKK